MKGYGFLSFARSLSNKYGNKLLDTATIIGLSALSTASKKVAHKAAEIIGEFIGNAIADKTAKPRPVPETNSRNVAATNSRNVEK